MAKRLNKKVALVGAAIIVVLGFLFIVVVLKFTQDPEKFLTDGNIAWQENDLEVAERNYLRARAKAKDDQFRVRALDKLIDLYLHIEKWPELRGCWSEVQNIQPDNLAIRYVQLKYFYIIANSGASAYWKDVETQASDFLDILSDEQLNEDTAQWENPYYEKVGMIHEPLAGSDGIQRIGQYLYLLRGNARLQIAASGAATEPDRVLAEAVEDLQKAQRLEPTNTKIALTLAQAFILEGELLASKGAIDERQKAQEKAVNILSRAVETTPKDPEAHINLLLTEQNAQLAAEPGIQQLASFEQRYSDLVEKFPDTPDVYAVQARFYYILGPDYIDSAIKAIEKAQQLEPENVDYIISAASIYDFKAAISGDYSTQNKAVDILNNAISLQGIKETQGPQRIRNINNRAAVYSFLAWIYLDRLLHHPETLTSQQKEQWLTQSELAAHELEQIYGSGDNPIVVKWMGILNIAKGNRTEGIQVLYALYQQQKAASRTDIQLAYFLAKQFEKSSEIGAVVDFYGRALKLGREDQDSPGGSIARRRPDALLDYASVLLRLKLAPVTLRVVNLYEAQFGKTDRSKKLLIVASIDSGDYEQAQNMLEKETNENPEIVQLKARLLQRKKTLAAGQIANQQLGKDRIELEQPQQEQQEQVDIEKLKKDIISYDDKIVPLIKQLLVLEPNSVTESTVINICRDYHRYEQTSKAKNLANQYLSYFPESISVKSYLKTLERGDEVTPEEQMQIQEQAILEISDPTKRALSLGVFYVNQEKNEQAQKQLQKVVDKFISEADNENVNKKLNTQSRIATSYLFELAVKKQDWTLAQNIIEIVQKNNFDDCHGDYFRARLSYMKADYEQTLTFLKSCLREKPVFSRAYLMRGQVNQALDRKTEAIEDFKQAVSLNPSDTIIAEALAVALYNRNRALGDNVTTDQFTEAKRAIVRAIGLSPSDINLQSFYAYYIKDDEPQKALSIRQRLYNYAPTVDNAILLASLASDLADKESDIPKKKVLLDLAEKTYEDTFQKNQDDKKIIASYAYFYRSIGQNEKADQIIERSQDKSLVWKHYLSSGRMDEAKQLLSQMYQQQPDNTEIVKALIHIAEKAFDTDDVKKLTNALLAIEENQENLLIQISSFLRSGLIKEAELRLQSFMEKYPNQPRAQLLASEIALNQGKIEKALELVSKSLETDQGNSDAWYLRGQINSINANYIQAISDINKSRALKDTPVARIALARAYMLSGRKNDAVNELSSIAYDPAIPERARLLLEAVYFQTADDAGLRNFYKEMINKFPGNTFWLVRAAGYLSQQRDLDNAETLYKIALDNSNKMNQPDAGALNGYLSVLLGKNQLQRVMKESEKYADSPLAYIALANMAQAKFKEGNRQKSIDYFKKAVEKSENNINFATQVLFIMAEVIGNDEVYSYCDSILAQNPDSLIANYVLAKLSERAGQFNKAVEYMDKTIHIVGEDDTQANSLMAEKAAMLSFAFDKYSDNQYLDQAIQIWQEILKKVPDDIGALNNIAYLLAQNNLRLDQALKYAETAQKKSPNNPSILDTYAYVLYKNSRFEEAAEYTQAAIQIFETKQAYAPTAVYEHLAMIKEKLGRTDEAVEAYQKMLEIGQNELSQKETERIKSNIDRLNNL